MVWVSERRQPGGRYWSYQAHGVGYWCRTFDRWRWAFGHISGQGRKSVRVFGYVLELRGALPLFFCQNTQRPLRRPAGARSGPNFHYTPPPAKSQSANCTKNHASGLPKLYNFSAKSSWLPGLAVVYLIQKLREGRQKAPKRFWKNRKNLLTNSARHDIIGTEVKGKRFLKRRKATVKKFPKKLLDKPSEKCYNESTKKPNGPWKVNILSRYQTPKSLKRSSKNLLTNRRKYDIIKSQKDKDSPKNQKGFEHGKD